MVAARDDDRLVRPDGVDQTMFIVDTPRPVASEVTPERFRLTDASKRCSQNVLDQLIDSLDQSAVMFLEPLVIAPAGWREGEIHSVLNSRFSVWPDSASAIERRRCAALAGLASRYSVSFHELNSSNGMTTTC